MYQLFISRKTLAGLIVIWLVWGCAGGNEKLYFSSMSGGWAQQEEVQFLFSPKKINHPTNMYIYLRNNDHYQMVPLLFVIDCDVVLECAYLYILLQAIVDHIILIELLNVHFLQEQRYTLAYIILDDNISLIHKELLDLERYYLSICIF